MEDDHQSSHTHKVPMATGALCPRRPGVEEVTPKEEEAEVVWESSGYKQRSGYTLTHTGSSSVFYRK